MRMIAYKGGGGVSRLRTYEKNFFRPQNLKTFLFLYKLNMNI